MAPQPLSARQQRVALALAGGASVARAARRCEAGERTVRRWLKERPDFAAEVGRLRTELFDRAIGRLSRFAGKGARELGKLLASSDERVRLGAAKALVALAMQSREAGELAEKVDELERLLREHLEHAAPERQGGPPSRNGSRGLA
jgi:hypothetical protein